ncbi:solute carrier family 15 member 5 [Dipodomys merriami]|uniref:solute carrier family 15 member 5 n=1 Tax=Dipodomys merriami TaxID=94247 RepID=UPI0038557715
MSVAPDDGPGLEDTLRPRGEFLSSDSVRSAGPDLCSLAVALGDSFVLLEIVCNVIPYCTLELGYRHDQAAILNLCFLGTSTLTPVLVSWLADLYVACRHRLLCVCVGLRLLGAVCLSLASFPGPGSEASAPRPRLFLAALLAAALGAGRPGPRARGEPAGKARPRPGRCRCPRLEAPLALAGVCGVQGLGGGRLVLPCAAALTALLALGNLQCQPEPRAEPAYGVVCVHPRSTRGPAAASQGGRAPEVRGDQSARLPRLLPLVISQLLLRMCVLQIPAGYFVQAMNSDWSQGGRLLPLAALAALGSLPGLLLTPALDRAPAGLLRACTVCGPLAAALSLGLAGLVEMRRRLQPLVWRRRPGGVAAVSSLPGLHLLPQYLLLGLADALGRPAETARAGARMGEDQPGTWGIQSNPSTTTLSHDDDDGDDDDGDDGDDDGGDASLLAESSVPGALQGEASRTLLPLLRGFACFAGALLVALVHLISEGHWFPATLNAGHLECFFFSLAALTLLSLLGFWNLPPR